MLKYFRRFHYLILYAILTFAFIVIFITMESIFEIFLPHVREFQIHFLKALLIVVFYEPLRSFTETRMRRWLFTYYHERQRQIRGLDSTLSSQSDFKALADTVTANLKEILRVQHVSLYLAIPDHFTLVSSTIRDEILTRRMRVDILQYEKSLSLQRVFSIDELLERQNGSIGHEPLTILRNEGAAYIVPLWKKEEMSYLVSLGQEIDSRNALMGEDKKILWHSLQRVGQTLEDARLNQQLKKSLMEKELVLDITKRFNYTSNLEQLLDMILDAVRAIVPYDAAGVFLVNQATQEIESAVVRGYDETALGQINIKVGTGLIGHVAKENNLMIVKDVSFDEHYVNLRPSTRSEIVVPICDGPAVIGVMNLESDHLAAYHEGFVDILTALAAEAAIAIRNAQLVEASIRNREMDKELQIAGRIQQAILPNRLPRIQNLDISASSKPCFSVGGDFYDVIRLNDHQIGICVGDVSGKGVPGAIMMAMLYAGYRGFVREFNSTSDTVSALNNLLRSNTAENMYATFFYTVIDFESLILYYTNAGHCPPFLYKKNGDVFKLSHGGIVLGFLADQEYSQMPRMIDPGDLLLLYTDGVTEVFNEADDMFGEDRVHEVIRQHRELPAKQIQEKIIDEVVRFTPDGTLQDDITVVVIKFEKKEGSHDY